LFVFIDQAKIVQILPLAATGEDLFHRTELDAVLACCFTAIIIRDRLLCTVMVQK